MKIETERLYLRPYDRNDLDSAFSVLGDQETMSFYPEPYSKERVKEFIEKQIRSFESHQYGLFAVVEKESDCFIGDCGISIQNIDGIKEFEIGYRIAMTHWGQGYAVEAAQAAKAYGFDVLGLDKICSYMGSDHLQSRRVAEKNGMNLEKAYINPNNRNLPTVVYSIFKNEYFEGEKDAVETC